MRRPVGPRAMLLCALALTIGGCRPPPSGDDAPQALFGRTGAGRGGFNYPRAAVIGASGDLFVVDKAARIHRFTQDGRFVGEWRMPEFDAGKPTGLGAGPDGRLYAADTHYGRVMIFSESGELLGRLGELGEGPGQFRLPTDVAVDRDGFVYVSEYGGNDRISKFTPSLEYVMSFGGRDAGAARLDRPQSLSFGPDQTLWVADACNHRICRFDRDGRLLAAFGQIGDGPGEFRFPYNVEALSDGSLIVAEYGNNRVQRLTPEGRCLGVWGRAGREPGELAYPWALAVGRGDRVFVVDSGNNRVQVIEGRSVHAPPPPTRMADQ